MTFNEYAESAMKTRKGWDDKGMEMAYYGLGLTGEAGECSDAIKKHLSGAKEIDRDHIKKELGDVLWYITATAEYFGFTMDDIAQTNIDKLKARHGDTWSGYGNRTGQGA
jgi:NTP pyrophosphatase (non-canonical NTP hydrolase)